MARNFTIFVSHSWDHNNDLEKLQNLLKERGYFNVEFSEVSKDEPINSENATYIKRRLRDKINDSNIVLALSGVYASHSDWMIWEMDTAIEKEIPIVGVAPRGNSNTSQEVQNRSIEDVKWNTESIVAAIRKHAN